MQMDTAKDMNVVIPLYKLLQYSNSYSKISVSLWQYYRSEPTLNDGSIVDFDSDNITDPFRFKAKITGTNNAAGTKQVEIAFETS